METTNHEDSRISSAAYWSWTIIVGGDQPPLNEFYKTKKHKAISYTHKHWVHPVKQFWVHNITLHFFMLQETMGNLISYCLATGSFYKNKSDSSTPTRNFGHQNKNTAKKKCENTVKRRPNLYVITWLGRIIQQLLYKIGSHDHHAGSHDHMLEKHTSFLTSVCVLEQVKPCSGSFTANRHKASSTLVTSLAYRA